MKKNKNKDYLTLANERYEDSKQLKSEKYAIELAKIKAINDRQTQKLQYDKEKTKSKHKHAIFNVFLGLISFVILLIILGVFGIIISK